MMQDTLFAKTLSDLNRIKRNAWLATIGISVIRTLSLGALALAVWSLVQPSRIFDQIIVSIIGTGLALVAARRTRQEHITRENFLFALEMSYPSTKYSPSSLEVSTSKMLAEEEWKPYLDREHNRLASFEWMRIRTRASTVLGPALTACLILSQTRPAVGTAVYHMAKKVFNFQLGATLQVIQGNATDVATKPIRLNPQQPIKLSLLDKNLIEVTVLGNQGDPAPLLYLKQVDTDGSIGTSGEIFQSFQLTPVHNPKDDASISRFSQALGVTSSTDLYISSVSTTKPLAHISVQALPVPVVSLTVQSPPKDPWPDDQPLSLLIHAEGKNPLAAVSLIIRTGKKEARELVNNVLVENKFSVDSDYQLVLEPYLESDVAEVEIIAEAVDRATPSALTGFSKPIRLTTASAYGRYQQSLQTLRELKALIDDAIAERKENLDPKADELMRTADRQSTDSPFFDAIDRVQIAEFGEKINKSRTEGVSGVLDDLSSEINDFLFDHESLDDRERDRDFFVAARGLSRILEQELKSRTTSVETVAMRMIQFVDGREARWKARVARLGPEFEPRSWPDILSTRPFHSTLKEIARIDKESPTASPVKSLEHLSKSVTRFRDWIAELESAEDKARERQEQERQKGLASAQDELKELQKVQGQISARLDRAGARENTEIKGTWPTVRMAQNGNISGTGRLEAKLRSLSPAASSRIRAAQQYMEKTVESGNGDQFVSAESHADFAGRLLRQAESAARESQGKQKSRGRRRRVTGDNYYGQSVVGGDVEIKREYEVDRRYREDILDEVRGAETEGENKAILDNYLRKVVR